MSTIVCKFGGSSLSDAGMFRRVISIIRSNQSRRYIVLSAPGKRNPEDTKVTDLLYEAYNAEPAQSPGIFSRFRERYAEIRDVLCPDFDLEGELCEIQEKLFSSADYAASRGEYLCAKLFAAAAGMPFVDASQLIHFHSDSTLDMRRTQKHIRSRLAGLECAVIPGFYGSLPDGSIKTFSRGGGDVSGAIIAACTNADLYENWTDVDGLFTADPNLITSARRNPLVSLDQMEKIANAGANLLHPDSLAVLRGRGIDTVIKNTFYPDCPGTRISESCGFPVKCVTGKRNLSAPVLRQYAPECSILQNTQQKYCVISAFGLDSTAMRRIYRRLKHVCIIRMQDHFKIITENEAYNTTVQIIHEMLDV